MAADSAVTVGKQKVFNTANKLFTLSKYRPVGIMVYGSAEFMGVPFETVIKTFRQQLGKKDYATVGGYANAFTRYLRSPQFRGSNIESTNAARVIYAVYARLTQLISSEAKQRDTSTDKLTPAQCKEVTDAFQTRIQRFGVLEQFKGVSASALQRRYRTEIGEIRKRFCTWPLWRTAAADLDRLCAIAIRAQYFSIFRSGIVVAGFGEDQIFPEFLDLNTDGFIAGRLKIGVQQAQKITRDTSAIVVPFAQTDMVQLFMEGVDRDYQQFLLRSVRELLLRVGGTIIDTYVGGSAASKDKLKNGFAASKAMEKILAAFWEQAKRYRNQNITQDIVTIVQSLQKSDLAELAEALVNLTSTKRQVTPQQETVGGAVDVAVISKGDGFIWMKRKHYFESQMNQHFLNNYYLN